METKNKTISKSYPKVIEILRRQTNIAEHEIIGFPSLFLTLYTFLLIDFPDETDIAPPTMPRVAINEFKSMTSID